jgi:hypothetical protein
MSETQIHQKYNLYHTFKNVKETDLPTTKKVELQRRLSVLGENLEKRHAIFLLIFEHALLEESAEISSKIVLPYEGESKKCNTPSQKGCRDIVFDLDKFPNKLKWILWKFTEIEKKKSV